MSLKRCYCLIGSLCLTFVISPAGAVEPDEVLISRDGVAVTVDDFERLVDVRIPEDKRPITLARPGAVRELIAQLFIIRNLAQEAENLEGLDHESIGWRAELQRNRIQMEELIKLRVAEAAARTDWDQLAREYYIAKQEEFMQPERVRASHVLIRAKDRDDEVAKTLAEEITERARGGEDFAALAEAHSEDPSAARNKGDLGLFGRGQMVPEFEQAAFALEKEGDIAGPVKSPFGYHVIRLTERQGPQRRPFDEVRATIIEDLQQKQAKEIRAGEVARIRSAEDTVANHSAIEALEASLQLDVPAMIREQKEGTAPPQGK